jgi:hypothetical protein
MNNSKAGKSAVKVSATLGNESAAVSTKQPRKTQRKGGNRQVKGVLSNQNKNKNPKEDSLNEKAVRGPISKGDIELEKSITHDMNSLDEFLALPVSVKAELINTKEEIEDLGMKGKKTFAPRPPQPITINNFPPPPPEVGEKKVKSKELGELPEMDDEIVLREEVPWYLAMANTFHNYIHDNIIGLSSLVTTTGIMAYQRHKVEKLLDGLFSVSLQWKYGKYVNVIKYIIGYLIKKYFDFFIGYYKIVGTATATMLLSTYIIRRFFNRTFKTVLTKPKMITDLVNRPTKHQTDAPENPDIKIYELAVVSEAKDKPRVYIKTEQLSSTALATLTDSQNEYKTLKTSSTLLNVLLQPRTLNTHLPLEVLDKRLDDISSNYTSQVFDARQLLNDDNNIIADTTTLAKFLMRKSLMKTRQLGFHLSLQESSISSATGSTNMMVLGGCPHYQSLSGASPLAHSIMNLPKTEILNLCRWTLGVWSTVTRRHTLTSLILVVPYLAKLSAPLHPYRLPQTGLISPNPSVFPSMEIRV